MTNLGILSFKLLYRLLIDIEGVKEKDLNIISL